MKITHCRQMREIVSEKGASYFSVINDRGEVEDVIKYWRDRDWDYCLACGWNNHHESLDYQHYMQQILDSVISYGYNIYYTEDAQDALERYYEGAMLKDRDMDRIKEMEREG